MMQLGFVNIKALGLARNLLRFEKIAGQARIDVRKTAALKL